MTAPSRPFALVTGACSAIGLEPARCFAEDAEIDAAAALDEPGSGEDD